MLNFSTEEGEEDAATQSIAEESYHSAVDNLVESNEDVKEISVNKYNQDGGVDTDKASAPDDETSTNGKAGSTESVENTVSTSPKNKDGNEIEEEVEVSIWTSNDENIMIETMVSFSGRGEEEKSEISVRKRHADYDETPNEVTTSEEETEESDDGRQIENVNSDAAIRGHTPSQNLPEDEKLSESQSSWWNKVQKKGENKQEPKTQEANGHADISSEPPAHNEKGGKIAFRERYPVPPIQPKARSAQAIIKDNRVDVPHAPLVLTKPRQDVQQLFDAIAGDSVARRSNACGTLKVMTTQKKNRWALLHTKGFLDALVSVVASDLPTEDAEIALDARARAVDCMLHVIEHKDHRTIVMSHKGLPESLVKCILEDVGEARVTALCVLATLAKTPACRELMIKVQDLIRTLSLVLKGEIFDLTGSNTEEQENVKEDDDDFSASSSDSSSSDSDETEEDDDETFDGTLDDLRPSYTTSSSDYSGSEIGSFSNRDSFESSYDESEVDQTMRHGNHARLDQTDSFQEKEAQSRKGRANACAALLHISKDCAAAEYLSRNLNFMASAVAVGGNVDDPLHDKCFEIICNLTRFPTNHDTMIKFPGIVDTLIVGGNAEAPMARLWSLRSLQNLSSQSSGKNILANRTMLEFLISSLIRRDPSEKLAAMATLYNLSTEPGAVVPLTNTKNVVATLVHAAHSPDTPAEIRSMACNSLATVGLWMQTLAGAGTVPKAIQPPVPLPSHVTTGWRRWD